MVLSKIELNGMSLQILNPFSLGVLSKKMMLNHYLEQLQLQLKEKQVIIIAKIDVVKAIDEIVEMLQCSQGLF